MNEGASGGRSSENYHVHFVLKAATPDTEQMCCVLNAVWAQHHAQTAPLAKNWIIPVQDRSAVASYVTHEYWRMGSDTLLDELCWDRTPVDTMAQYHHDQQAHRITRAASPLWLRQAQQALNTQQAAYQANADQFVMERG